MKGNEGMIHMKSALFLYCTMWTSLELLAGPSTVCLAVSGYSQCPWGRQVVKEACPPIQTVLSANSVLCWPQTAQQGSCSLNKLLLIGWMKDSVVAWHWKCQPRFAGWETLGSFLHSGHMPTVSTALYSLSRCLHLQGQEICRQYHPTAKSVCDLRGIA